MHSIFAEHFRSLSDSVPHFLEALVGLIGDDYGNVAKKAQTALEAFSASQAGTSGESRLVQILEENLYSLATSLPRRLKMCGRCFLSVGGIADRVLGNSWMLGVSGCWECREWLGISSTEGIS